MIGFIAGQNIFRQVGRNDKAELETGSFPYPFAIEAIVLAVAGIRTNMSEILAGNK